MKNLSMENSNYPPSVPAGNYRFTFITYTQQNRDDVHLLSTEMLIKIAKKSYKNG